MYKQFIVFGEFAYFHAPFEEFYARIQLFFRRRVVVKRAYKTNTYTVFVVAEGVGPDVVPAAAVVCGAVPGHQEVVANVVPIPRLNVKHLYETYSKNALALELEDCC